MNLSFCFLPLLLLVHSFSVHCAPLPHSSYDHFQLVQTWPQTFCLKPNMKCKTPLPKGFTLHGLWPADSKGNTMRKCNNSTPDLSTVVTELGSDLTAVWPSIRYGKKDEEFWSHEWKEHGSCSASKMNMSNYFKSAVREKKKINLLDTLKAANIIPKNGSSYSKLDIENAVKQITGTANDVYVSCSRHVNDDQLYEIYICLDKTAINYVPCPYNKDSRGCGGVGRQAKIKFPA